MKFYFRYYYLSKNEYVKRPILRGRDIKKYGHNYDDLWIINSHNGIKEKGIKPINIDDFPIVKNHLDQYYKQLEKRSDKGDSAYNLRNCAYMDDLNMQKIIWGEISDRTKFCIDLNGEFANEATTFLMTGDSLIFLLGYLNSKLSEYFFSKIGTTTGVGTVRWKKFTIEQLPVPNVNLSDKKGFEDIILQIIEMTKYKKDTFKLEKQFDYKLYNYLNFSDEEINFIESQ